MIKLIFGVLFSQITFTLAFDFGTKVIPLQVLPTFIGYFLIIVGSNEIESKSVQLRQQATKVLNFVLFVGSLIASTLKMYLNMPDVYMYMTMALTLLSYYQLFVISKAMVDIDATYYLRKQPQILFSYVTVCVGLEIISMILSILNTNVALQYTINMIIYAIDFMYVFKLYEIHQALKKV